MLSQNALIHVTTRELWEAGAARGSYVPPGFESEGFIHCCTRSQLERVLADHFEAQDAVCLLVLDAAVIKAEVKYERAANGDDYPHIYGPIEPSAVIETHDAPHRDEGWLLP